MHSSAVIVGHSAQTRISSANDPIPTAPALATLASAWNGTILEACEHIMGHRAGELSLVSLSILILARIERANRPIQPSTARTIRAIRPTATESAAEIIARIARHVDGNPRAIRWVLAHSKRFAELRESAGETPLPQCTGLLRWLEAPARDGYGITRCRYEQIRDGWVSVATLLEHTWQTT